MAISDNSQTVNEYLSKDMEPQLKWDKNYIVNIVLITEYGNASSAANFSKKDIETRHFNIIFFYHFTGTHPLLAVGNIYSRYEICLICECS